MSRAAFLPTPGDPFLLTLWFQFYERWAKHVDTLYVLVNSGTDSTEVMEYIRNQAGRFDNVQYIELPHQIEHGEALRRLTELAEEDYILIIEDDGFIFKPEIVDECFKLLEGNYFDLVGSRRGSCSQWLYDQASAKFGLDNSGYGDHGPNFWPNFLFVKREDLLRTSRNFGARFWAAGETVEVLGKPAPEDQASDTFVQASLELRALGLRVKTLPQYHGNTDDEPDYRNKTNLWDGTAPWTHVGSLSSGFHGLLDPTKDLPRGAFSTDQEKLELERRIVFWYWGWLISTEATDAIPATHKAYHARLQQLINTYELSEVHMRRRLEMYQEVMYAN